MQGDVAASVADPQDKLATVLESFWAEGRAVNDGRKMPWTRGFGGWTKAGQEGQERA
jgi:hypothetical protein